VAALIIHLVAFLSSPGLAALLNKRLADDLSSCQLQRQMCATYDGARIPFYSFTIMLLLIFVFN